MKQNQFISTILSFSHENHLWQRGDRILAAVSGGPDSLGLLLFLHEVAEEEGLTVGCCCVDHHLRPESGAEAAYVGEVCRKLSIPFAQKDVDVEGERQENRGSVETVARELRYAALREVAEEGRYTAIATAHHADDQAETILFHLLRGAGTKGLSGMAPRRGDIIRPFLPVTKADIETFISHFPVMPCHDETNDIPDVTRNKIRLTLLPQLLSYNPRLVRDLTHMASILREEDRCLEDMAAEFLRRGKREGSVFFLPRKEFGHLPLALKRRILLAVLRSTGGKTEDFDGVERLRHLAETGTAGKKISSSGVMMEVGKEELLFYPGSTRKTKNLPVEDLISAIYENFKQNALTDWASADIIEKNDAAQLDGWRMQLAVTEGRPTYVAKNQILLDADQVGHLCLRYPRERERFFPRGMEGTKRISAILSEAGLPAAVRNLWPLLCDEKQAYWVGLLRGSRFGLPDDTTRRFLVVTLIYTRRAYDGKSAERCEKSSDYERRPGKAGGRDRSPDHEGL